MAHEGDHTEFMRVLTEHSFAPYPECLDEWRVYSYEWHPIEAGEQCICRHPIANVYTIQHRYTGTCLPTGCVCVEKLNNQYLTAGVRRFKALALGHVACSTCRRTFRSKDNAVDCTQCARLRAPTNKASTYGAQVALHIARLVEAYHGIAAECEARRGGRARVGFGKYAALTRSEAYAANPSYFTEWLQCVENPTQRMRSCAQWAAALPPGGGCDELVGFGTHAQLTVAEVHKAYPTYFTWLRSHAKVGARARRVLEIAAALCK